MKRELDKTQDWAVVTNFIGVNKHLIRTITLGCESLPQYKNTIIYKRHGISR